MHWPRMKSSPCRPLILKRRKQPASHGAASTTLAGEDSGGRGKGQGQVSHLQARTREPSTSRKTPGTPKFPPGLKILSHPAMSDAQVVAVPADRNVLPIIEAPAAKGKEWGSSKPNKFILISSGSSSPTTEARECNQLFKSEDRPSIPCHKVHGEGDAGPSSGAMKWMPAWASEAQSVDGQEPEGNSSTEAPSCELDHSLTNIQWLGKMGSGGLSPCGLEKGMEKENQTPKQDAAVQQAEKGAVPSSSTAPWQEPFPERPPYSYMAMIQFAINSTEKKRMTLKDIYTWIEDHFPYFKHVAKPGWKNSIRHNLSLHDMFVRETPAHSKISFWTIQPEANRYLTLDQVFKQQKRCTPDLQKSPGGTGRKKAEPQSAGRPMKLLLPRVDSYLVPVQFPQGQSLVLQPSARIPLLVPQSTSGPVQCSRRMLPSHVKPEIPIREEVCGGEGSSPWASQQSTKEDACQANRGLLPAVPSIKKESDFLHPDEWAPPFQTAFPVQDPLVQGEEELNSFLPVPEEQKQQPAALQQPPEERPDSRWCEVREIGRSRRKQLLALPCLKEPVLLLPKSCRSESLPPEPIPPLEEEARPLGNTPPPHPSQGPCGPLRTPVQESLRELPGPPAPCAGASLTLTDSWRAVPFPKETGAQDFSPRKSPPIPMLSLQQSLDLSTSPRPSMSDSPQPLLLNTEASDMVSGPLISSPASSNQAPPEFPASVLPGNGSLQEGLFLDTMNESLSKILLDISFPGFEEDDLGTDLSWSQFVPDQK
ncbi:forkhead box protein M1 isoform X3 [Paroedura picta]|uniref:forkhead box protein M1 isoform X3 n=1 Tax=Paroedura picta TaxID=143630 RepID=UPI004056FB66